MGFRCGIVGLPNVGKSTLFNALTETQAAQAANYPFCTIEPNVGQVAVPDERLDRIAAIAKSAKVVPTQLAFVDIAGLVEGASARGKVWATSSSVTSARWTPLFMSCAVSRMTISSTSPTVSTRWPMRRWWRPNCCSPTSTASRSGWRTPAAARLAATRKPRRLVSVLGQALELLKARQARAPDCSWATTRKRGCSCPGAAADRQAGALCL